MPFAHFTPHPDMIRTARDAREQGRADGLHIDLDKWDVTGDPETAADEIHAVLKTQAYEAHGIEGDQYLQAAYDKGFTSGLSGAISQHQHFA